MEPCVKIPCRSDSFGNGIRLHNLISEMPSFDFLTDLMVSLGLLAKRVPDKNSFCIFFFPKRIKLNANNINSDKADKVLIKNADENAHLICNQE